MTFLPTFRIRSKLALMFSLLIALISLFIFVYFPSRLEENEFRAVTSKARTIAEMTAYSVSPALVFDDHLGAMEALNSARQNQDVVYLVVVDDSGKVFDSFDRVNFLHSRLPALMGDSQVSADGTLYETKTPIFHNEQIIGQFYMGMSLEGIRAEIGQSRKTVALVSLIVFLLGIIVVLGISTIMTGPLSHMVKTFEQIAQGDLSQRAPVRTSDEVGHMATSFNQMVNNLESVYGELEKMNRDLERRVKERTKKLQEEIAERLKAEQQLRLQAAALQSAANAIAITDRQGEIIWVNSSFTKLTGYSIDEVRGNNPRLLKSGKHDKPFYEHLWNTILAGGFWSGEIINRQKDGRLYTEYQTITPVRDEKGEITHFISIKEDITKRKQAEEALRESEDRFRSAFQNAPTGVVILGTSQNFIRVNLPFCEMLGYSEDELVGNMFSKVVHEDDFAKAIEYWEKIHQENGEAGHFQVRFVSKGGSVVWADVSSSVVRDVAQNPLYCICQIQDMTERKRLEEELRQAQKLESLGTLAGGVAHDFNNILSIILGYNSLMRRPTFDSARLPQITDTIGKAVERGAGLVRQLLTFARKSDVEFVPVKINDIINDITKLLTQTFPKTITLSLNLDRNCPPVNADANQMHQVFLNLCVNARDAMSNAGTLTIGTEVVDAEHLHEQFAELTEGKFVCVRVTDTGTGMDEVTRCRIFEPFFTTKELGKGTGLGLATVYGIVKSHHGYVNVESEIGRGTTFFLYFPAEIVELKSPEEEVEEKKEIKGGTETLLLVEDEEPLRDLVRAILTDKGYKVLTAKDGEEAVELFREHTSEVSAVILDMGLPKRSGWHAFQQMRKIYPVVKGIFASGFFDPIIKSEMVASGVSNFIQKPYKTNELLAKLREVLDRA